MNEYVFYTLEGGTEAPNPKWEGGNCQYIGRATGDNQSQAVDRLLAENPWIKDAGFNPRKFMVEQVVTDSQRQDIATVVEYLWDDEKRHFEECRDSDPAGKCEDHIYNVLKRLRTLCAGRRIAKAYYC